MNGSYASVNGIKLYYESQGVGDPLVFLHGAFGSLESFREMLPAFSDEFQVIAMDSRGHGRSTDGETLLSYSLLASDVIELLNHLGIEKAAVIGWSDGGILGLELAIHCPSRISALVAMSANFSTKGLTDFGVEKICRTSIETLDPFTVAFYRRVSPHPDHFGVLVDKVKYMLLTEPNFTAEQLQRIPCPTLILSGENEEMVAKEHTEELSRAIPGAELRWLKDAGHFLLFEDAAGAAKIILEFLRSTRSAERVGSQLADEPIRRAQTESAARHFR